MQALLYHGHGTMSIADDDVSWNLVAKGLSVDGILKMINFIVGAGAECQTDEQLHDTWAAKDFLRELP